MVKLKMSVADPSWGTSFELMGALAQGLRKGQRPGAVGSHLETCLLLAVQEKVERQPGLSLAGEGKLVGIGQVIADQTAVRRHGSGVHLGDVVIKDTVVEVKGSAAVTLTWKAPLKPLAGVRVS